MANYVKFMRGTPEAFAKLPVKDKDTLYFIAAPDATDGMLYLGSKIISREGDNLNASSIDALKDVLITENLIDNSFLTYDAKQQLWVNTPIDKLLFVGCTESSSGVAGLVPPSPVNSPNLFLRSDGKWAKIETSGEAGSQNFVETLINNENVEHLTLINTYVSDKPVTCGDIIIVKDILVEDKMQYTAYVYDGENWSAMDGNYDAENVYLKDNLTITADIGAQTLDGQAFKTLETSGKNIKQVFDMILAARKLPKYSNPSVSVVCPQAGTYEVGTSVTPSYTATLNVGKYDYEPGTSTGVAATSWSATFAGQTVAKQSGTFDAVVVTDGFNEKVNVTVNYSAGAVPKDNLGNTITDAEELSECQIPAGTKTTSSNSAIKGCRYMFYGSKTDAIELSSEKIRKLNSKEAAATSFELEVVEGSYQVIIAVPEEFTLAKVEDTAALKVDIKNSFKLSEIMVAGASDGYDKQYNVYVYSPSAALGANTYIVTIK